MDSTKCKETVYPNERWGSFHPHQCHKNIWKDGYCKQHHPDTEEARHKAREVAWKAKQENDPLRLLQKANKRIEELEAENRILKDRINDMAGKIIYKLELEKKLAVSEEIRTAEKKILIEEIEKNKILKERVGELEEQIGDSEKENFFTKIERD